MTPFLGQIQVFGFPFAPVGWAFCNGALLPVSQYSSLYSLLGTAYGGNGTSTFGLPNLTGSTVCGQGNGIGLSPRTMGETFGEIAVTVLVDEMPAHTHTQQVGTQSNSSLRTVRPAQGSHLLSPTDAAPFINAANVTPDRTFSPLMLGPSGQSQPHENRQPYLGINFCIAMTGDFPQWS